MTCAQPVSQVMHASDLALVTRKALCSMDARKSNHQVFVSVTPQPLGGLAAGRARVLQNLEAGHNTAFELVTREPLKAAAAEFCFSACLQPCHEHAVWDGIAAVDLSTPCSGAAVPCTSQEGRTC